MRSYPTLIHPVRVRLERIDKSRTVYDESTRAPVQQATRKPVIELQGQVKYGTSKEITYETAGTRESESGYVLFRTRDLEAVEVTLSIGDRITKIGAVEHDAYIIRLEPKGHYGDLGGATLIKAYFEDRQPGKQPRRLS